MRTFQERESLLQEMQSRAREITSPADLCALLEQASKETKQEGVDQGLLEQTLYSEILDQIKEPRLLDTSVVNTVFTTLGSMAANHELYENQHLVGAGRERLTELSIKSLLDDARALTINVGLTLSPVLIAYKRGDRGFHSPETGEMLELLRRGHFQREGEAFSPSNRAKQQSELCLNRVVLSCQDLPREVLQERFEDLLPYLEQGSLTEAHVKLLAEHPASDLEMLRELTDVVANNYPASLRIIAGRAEARRDPEIRQRLKAKFHRDDYLLSFYLLDAGAEETQSLFQELSERAPELAAGLLDNPDFHSLSHLRKEDLSALLIANSSDVRLAAIRKINQISCTRESAASRSRM